MPPGPMGCPQELCIVASPCGTCGVVEISPPPNCRWENTLDGATVKITGPDGFSFTGPATFINSKFCVTVPAPCVAGSYTVTLSKPSCKTYSGTIAVPACAPETDIILGESYGNTCNGVPPPTKVLGMIPGTVVFNVLGCNCSITYGGCSAYVDPAPIFTLGNLVNVPATITVTGGGGGTGMTTNGVWTWQPTDYGPFSYTVTSPRSNPATGNALVPACLPNPIPPQPCIYPTPLVIPVCLGPPMSGEYVCCPSLNGCPDPIATVLHLTDPVFGPVTLNYNGNVPNPIVGGPGLGPGWTGSITVTSVGYPPNGCLPSPNVTVRYDLLCSTLGFGSLGIYWTALPGQCNTVVPFVCPSGAGGATLCALGAGFSASVSTCPPSFLFMAPLLNPSTPATFPPWAGLYGGTFVGGFFIGPGGNFVVTE